MTKNERIAKLEASIRSLWEHHIEHRERLEVLENEVRALKKRLAVEVEVLDKELDDMREGTEDWLESVLGRLKALEARPIMPWYVPTPNRWPPPGPFTLGTISQCTCGTTIPCPVPGHQLGTYSWDGSTLDADGHVQ